jgi:hypothetical protein
MAAYNALGSKRPRLRCHILWQSYTQIGAIRSHLCSATFQVTIEVAISASWNTPVAWSLLENPGDDERAVNAGDDLDRPATAIRRRG